MREKVDEWAQRAFPASCASAVETTRICMHAEVREATSQIVQRHLRITYDRDMLACETLEEIFRKACERRGRERRSRLALEH